MSRPVFSFRPNPENLEHRRAWEILKSVPEGQKNAFLVRAILHEEQSSRLEEMLRRAVREEIQSICSEENFRKTVWKGKKNIRFEKTLASENRGNGETEIPEQMLDFLSRME